MWPGLHAVCNIKSVLLLKVKSEDELRVEDVNGIGHLSLAMISVVV